METRLLSGQLLVRGELDHAVVPCRVAADTGLGGRTTCRFTARHGVGARDPGRRHFYFSDPGGGHHGADGRAADAAGGDTDDPGIYGLLDDFLSGYSPLCNQRRFWTPAGEVPDAFSEGAQNFDLAPVARDAPSRNHRMSLMKFVGVVLPTVLVGSTVLLRVHLLDRVELPAMGDAVPVGLDGVTKVQLS